MIWKKILFWSVAVVLTLAASVYQRKTGPTYPKRYTIVADGETLTFDLPRSHGGESDCRIAIAVPEGVTGDLIYRRYPGTAPFDTLVLNPADDSLVAVLPHQPPAGKLEYHLLLRKAGKSIDLGDRENIVIRFKGSVPLWALFPHILLMFLAMIWSNGTALLAAGNISTYRKNMLITILLFLAGGFIFGPIVQYYAFGDFWTGWPNGKDLTDNKVLISIIVWLAAWLLNRKQERRWIVILAALVLLAIYMIPHSMNGSELDYESGEVVTGSLLFLTGLKGFKKFRS